MSLIMSCLLYHKLNIRKQKTRCQTGTCILLLITFIPSMTIILEREKACLRCWIIVKGFKREGTSCYNSWIFRINSVNNQKYLDDEGDDDNPVFLVCCWSVSKGKAHTEGKRSR